MIYIFNYIFNNAASTPDIKTQLFYLMIMDELNVCKN